MRFDSNSNSKLISDSRLVIWNYWFIIWNWELNCFANPHTVNCTSVQFSWNRKSAERRAKSAGVSRIPDLEIGDCFSKQIRKRRFHLGIWLLVITTVSLTFFNHIIYEFWNIVDPFIILSYSIPKETSILQIMKPN